MLDQTQTFGCFVPFRHFTANHNNSMVLLWGVFIQDLHISRMNNSAGEGAIIAYFTPPNLSLTNIKDGLFTMAAALLIWAVAPIAISARR